MKMQQADPLADIVKNKELFLKAQQKPKHDWFTQMESERRKPRRNGLSEEQEIQIGLDMIPMFKAKE
jgi:hypothetical protein